MRREWIVDDLDEYGDVDRGAIANALVEVESIGHRIGGAFIIAPIREQIPGTEEYKVRYWRFRHDSFMPAARAADVGDVPEPEDVEDFAEPEQAEVAAEPEAA